MKICRFCQHSQEDGNNCEACGAPFSADKLDFSSEDIMMGVAGTTGSSDAQMGAAGTTDTQVPDTRPAEEVSPEPISGTDKTPDETLDETPHETSDEQTDVQPTPETKPEKKVWYAASGPKDSVYNTRHLVGIGSGAQAIKSAKAGSSSNAADALDSTGKLASTALVVNLACIFCTCGFSFVSLILAIYAYVKMKSLKTGKAQDPKKALSLARTYSIVSLVILGVVVLFVVIAFFMELL